MVSSWEYFPWMMDVCSLRPWLSTAFQTYASQTGILVALLHCARLRW